MSQTSCKKCDSTKFVKAVLIRNNQRYKCKLCGFQFTNTPKIGVDDRLKKFAIALYANFGVFMNRISIFMNVSPVSALRWVRSAGRSTQVTDKKAKSGIVMADEMWRFVNGKEQDMALADPDVLRGYLDPVLSLFGSESSELPLLRLAMTRGKRALKALRLCTSAFQKPLLAPR